MFIGHYGLGMAAKPLNKKISLGTLILASQFIDLLWPVFLLLGFEKVEIEKGNTRFTPLNFVSYPFSHSLLGVMFWAFLFGAVYFFFRKDIKSSLLLGALVLSHWFLDRFVHKPDLQLLPWSDYKVGFSLWNSIPATIILEGIIFIAGIVIFYITSDVKKRKVSIRFWLLIFVLILSYVLNIIMDAPPSQNAIAYTGLFLWLFVIWGYWIDAKKYKSNE